MPQRLRFPESLFASPVTSIELFVAIGLIGLISCILSFLFLTFLDWGLYAFNIMDIGGTAIAVFASLLLLFGWVAGSVLLMGVGGGWALWRMRRSSLSRAAGRGR